MMQELKKVKVNSIIFTELSKNREDMKNEYKQNYCE